LSEFVTVELGSIFRDARRRFESLRDEIATEDGKILRREEESSIRLRWYDEGRTLNSLQEEFVTEGNARIYLLFPTSVSIRGAPYPTFGEYGTGQEGARTGQPAPKGYRYGDRVGMRARRYSRIAVGIAQPLITAKAKEVIANFTIS
jgi:hypothetical protein